MLPSSSGPGHRILIPATWVRFPLGVPKNKKHRFWCFYFFLAFPGIESMNHGVRTAAKRWNNTGSPTRGNFARWRKQAHWECHPSLPMQNRDWLSQKNKRHPVFLFRYCVGDFLCRRIFNQRFFCHFFQACWVIE